MTFRPSVILTTIGATQPNFSIANLRPPKEFLKILRGLYPVEFNDFNGNCCVFSVISCAPTLHDLFAEGASSTPLTTSYTDEEGNNVEVTTETSTDSEGNTTHKATIKITDQEGTTVTVNMSETQDARGNVIDSKTTVISNGVTVDISGDNDSSSPGVSSYTRVLSDGDTEKVTKVEYGRDKWLEFRT